MTKEYIKEEMFILKDKLKNHENEFNMAENDDLIEALIYEQKALQSRFTFLMKQAREIGLEVDFVDNN